MASEKRKHPDSDKGPLIYLCVGEPSGDQIGSRLMRALKTKTGGRVRFAGLGGDLMAAEGLESFFPIDELAVMGVFELLPQARKLFKRMDEVADHVRALQPDMFLSIDAPGFGLRVARRLKGAGIPLVHYVAPTVWGWGGGRARRISKYLDHLFLLFPFEAPYFEKHGLATTFVGHAAAETAVRKGDGHAFRKRHGIPADVPLLAVLPGSRRGEVKKFLPVLKDTLDILVRRFPNLHCAVPTVYTVADTVTEAAAEWPCPATVVRGLEEKLDAFAAADVALAASGTVTLETALSGLPTVLFYRIHPLTAFSVRLIASTHFVNVLNYMAGREILPEILQERLRPDILAEETAKLLGDESARKAQQDAVAPFAAQLLPGDMLPSERAAEAVLELLGAFGRRRNEEADR